MRATVLKTFSYSDDGVRVITLHAGDVVEIKDDLAKGLTAAKQIAPIEEWDPTMDLLDEQLPVTGGLQIKHTGRGRYAIYRGEERLTQDALTKEEARSALAEMINAPTSENAEG